MTNSGALRLYWRERVVRSFCSAYLVPLAGPSIDLEVTTSGYALLFILVTHNESAPNDIGAGVPKFAVALRSAVA